MRKSPKIRKKFEVVMCLLFSLCSLVYHDLFRDPLNWSKPGEAVPEGPLKALRSMCKRTDHGSVTIALDSLSWLLCHIPCVTLCQALHALSQQNGDPGAVPPLFCTLIQLFLPKDATPFHSLRGMGISSLTFCRFLLGRIGGGVLELETCF